MFVFIVLKTVQLYTKLSILKIYSCVSNSNVVDSVLLVIKVTVVVVGVVLSVDIECPVRYTPIKVKSITADMRIT